jgi:hypothetical protein
MGLSYSSDVVDFAFDCGAAGSLMPTASEKLGNLVYVHFTLRAQIYSYLILYA